MKRIPSQSDGLLEQIPWLQQCTVTATGEKRFGQHLSGMRGMQKHISLDFGTKIRPQSARQTQPLLTHWQSTRRNCNHLAKCMSSQRIPQLPILASTGFFSMKANCANCTKKHNTLLTHSGITTHQSRISSPLRLPAPLPGILQHSTHAPPSTPLSTRLRHHCKRLLSTEV